MGFSTIMDIVGSIVIGGYLLLLLTRLNASANENSFSYNEELVLQQNLATVAHIVEYDFRKIGYCADFDAIEVPSKAIIFADSTRINFLTDVDRDSTVDTIHYYLGPASELSNTKNPRDRMLYRVVNHETPRSSNLGVTEFRLVYMDENNKTMSYPINDPGEIASMEINIAVEKTDAYGLDSKDRLYSGAFWRQIRLVARNLENR
jgi:type II secretory pathway component PulJ